MTERVETGQTPRVDLLFELLKEAFENAPKPPTLPTFGTPEPWFSESWGGIRILNEETEGEHFWLGIWWHEPRLLRFEFAPALYNKKEGVHQDEFDWWPYVKQELTSDFFRMSREDQLAYIKRFITATLEELAEARSY